MFSGIQYCHRTCHKYFSLYGVICLFKINKSYMQSCISFTGLLQNYPESINEVYTTTIFKKATLFFPHTFSPHHKDHKTPANHDCLLSTVVAILNILCQEGTVRSLIRYPLNMGAPDTIIYTQLAYVLECSPHLETCRGICGVYGILGSIAVNTKSVKRYTKSSYRIHIPYTSMHPPTT